MPLDVYRIDPISQKLSSQTVWNFMLHKFHHLLFFACNIGYFLNTHWHTSNLQLKKFRLCLVCLLRKFSCCHINCDNLRWAKHLHFANSFKHVPVSGNVYLQKSVFILSLDILLNYKFIQNLIYGIALYADIVYNRGGQFFWFTAHFCMKCKFILLKNILRGPDKRPRRSGFGPGASLCPPLFYNELRIFFFYSKRLLYISWYFQLNLATLRSRSVLFFLA